MNGKLVTKGPTQAFDPQSGCYMPGQAVGFMSCCSMGTNLFKKSRMANFKPKTFVLYQDPFLLNILNLVNQKWLSYQTGGYHYRGTYIPFKELSIKAKPNKGPCISTFRAAFR